MPPPPPPPNQPRPPPSLPPRTPDFHPGEWLPQGEGGQQARSAPATGLAALGLSDSTIHTVVVAMQGVVAGGVTVEFPSPAQSVPTVKVATLSLLYLRFVCGVAADVELTSIWESVSRGRSRMDGLAALNLALMRGLPSCRRVFGGRADFRASLPLIAFVKNVSLLNPSLDPDCTGGGVHALGDSPRIG